MADILHRIIIETSPAELFKALIHEEKLSAWWTDTQSSGELNSTAQFFFGEDGNQVDMEIVELVPNQTVSWKCTEGPWVDTGNFTFRVYEDARGVKLLFSHEGWPEADEFFMHCNGKWGFFLGVSLKRLLETGTGQPHPMEPNI